MGNNSSTATHEPLDKNFTRGTFGDVNSKSFRQSKRSPRKMDRLRKSFRDSFRRRKDRVPESAKPHQWQADESAVRSATCSFPVKYLGCVEVFESRGMLVCEEALKVLRNSRRRAVRGLLHVSGDGLRVVDDDTKGLIVDQTIEKVSFCAPDRNHERGFSYICRDGTTRRWMCHGFLASKDSGERLSHAVGCAFAVCLDRKQRRDKECGVTMTFDRETSTFTRTGSFRTQSITERLAANERGIDTPSATVTPMQSKAFNPFAIERPHATPSMLERQNSFRGFNALGASSPFKRQMSLRINDLPSNAERQRAFFEPLTVSHRGVSPIPEVSPMQIDSVSQLCQELSQGLSMLTKNDSDDLNFNNQTSINQNMAAAILHSPTSPSNNFINNSSTSPLYSASNSKISIGNIASIAPFTTPTSSNSSQIVTAQISPRQRPSIPTAIVQRVVPIETVNPLPNPEQWLGQIVKNTSPSPKRAPTFNINSRTKSLNMAGDPFDAEWAAPAVQTEVHSTNPFISPPKPPAESFQVQL